MPTRLDDLPGRAAPDRPALTFGDRTVTYAELAAEVRAAGARLRDLGLRRGERVAVYLEKRIETVVALFAVSAAGGVVVPVNPVATPPQVRHILADCAAALVVTSAPRLRALGPDLPARVVPIDELCPSAVRPADDTAPVVAESDVAAIFYTSGSTGGPKGVMVSHRNLLTGARSVAGYLGHTVDDVVLSVLPLSFDAGFSQLTTGFLAGAHVVLINYLTPGEVVRACVRHGVTALTCVPPLWRQLAARPWPATRLRYWASTGGPMPAATLARLREIFPAAAPYLMYGLTEAFRSTYLDPAEIDRRPGSIGKAIPDAEVVVVRPDGSQCAPGEPGELVHRGPLVALGYWNDPERTAARFRPFPPGTGEIAAWSGDLVRRDEDGFLYFVGRTDEMIKTSGYRVSPTEIEDAAYATGLVGEAVAFGVADEDLGQRIVLAVSGCRSEPLVTALRRGLPGYLVPRQVLELAELPRSANGKFDRVELRRMVSA
ncbi:acyl-CoA ligase (AMP-forming), exosortase A system-associated [Actinokineospora xionganensis]|uniref:acyl-CoA ligase (AMP-forming), exosortase A system-associated n=1 Tax=Actinokineospora xionganensis TaxID=2684470 RepID=UPI001C9D4FB7|nr:acyl-CoA ligase (AMP-forming), exosortase A system-associated [Actinokineospora xionganensis]